MTMINCLMTISGNEGSVAYSSSDGGSPSLGELS